MQNYFEHIANAYKANSQVFLPLLILPPPPKKKTLFPQFRE